ATERLVSGLVYFELWPRIGPLIRDILRLTDCRLGLFPRGDDELRCQPSPVISDSKSPAAAPTGTRSGFGVSSISLVTCTSGGMGMGYLPSKQALQNLSFFG